MKRDSENKAVFFADLVGSSILYDLLGDDKARNFTYQGIETISLQVQNHNGTLIKTIGDEVMAVFDHADDALKAALKIRPDLQNIYMPCGTYLHKLSAKIGIHYGPVLMENQDVFGHSVNIAARMVSLCKPKQILTTGQTVAHLSEDLQDQMRLADHLAPKGMKQELDVFEALDGQDDRAATIPFGSVPSPGFRPRHLEIDYKDQHLTVDRQHRSISLGRDQENDIVISGDGISRHHARIEYRKNKFVLVDNSTNGTFVQPDNHVSSHIRHDEFVLQNEGDVELKSQFGKNASYRIHYSVKTD